LRLYFSRAPHRRNCPAFVFTTFGKHFVQPRNAVVGRDSRVSAENCFVTAGISWAGEGREAGENLCDPEMDRASPLNYTMHRGSGISNTTSAPGLALCLVGAVFFKMLPIRLMALR